AGGTEPISRSRVIPPALAAANDRTSTPKRSRRCLTPTTAPLSANTNVPIRSSTRRVPDAYSLNAPVTSYKVLAHGAPTKGQRTHSHSGSLRRLSLRRYHGRPDGYDIVWFARRQCGT